MHCTPWAQARQHGPGHSPRARPSSPLRGSSQGSMRCTEAKAYFGHVQLTGPDPQCHPPQALQDRARKQVLGGIPLPAATPLSKRFFASQHLRFRSRAAGTTYGREGHVTRNFNDTSHELATGVQGHSGGGHLKRRASKDYSSIQCGCNCNALHGVCDMLFAFFWNAGQFSRLPAVFITTLDNAWRGLELSCTRRITLTFPVT